MTFDSGTVTSRVGRAAASAASGNRRHQQGRGQVAAEHDERDAAARISAASLTTTALRRRRRVSHTWRPISTGAATSPMSRIGQVNDTQITRPSSHAARPALSDQQPGRDRRKEAGDLGLLAFACAIPARARRRCAPNASASAAS